jgi:hypothetical protein
MHKIELGVYISEVGFTMSAITAVGVVDRSTTAGGEVGV